MNTQTQSAVFEVMQQRHSVKEYQPDHVMPKEHLEQLLQATILAPSSWNLQHWKFLVIDDAAQKQTLLPIAYNQQQVVQSSVVIAVLGDLEANKNAEAVFGPAVQQGFMPQEVMDTLVSQINGAYAGYPNFGRDEAIRNASLAAMQLMLAAKAMGYDTCPMGGFNPQQFVEAFHVPERYVPVMLITVGMAAQEARPSSRLSLDEVVVRNSF